MNDELFGLAGKLKHLETPFYYYDLKLLRQTLDALTNNGKKYQFKNIHYALKANFNNKIISIIKDYGLGADCVSGNEVKKAIELGFSSEDIVFAGVGKSDKEIIYALSKKIFCFNCESSQELQVINDLAGKLGHKAKVALRINPNVRADAHHHTTTGMEENKFGIYLNQLPEALDIIKASASLEFIGIHFHIGSGINGLGSFKNLCLKVNEIQTWFNDRGIIIEHLNMGGGLGVDYFEPDKHPVADFDAYFNVFHKNLEIRPNQHVHFELGRCIVAQCGSLISKVLYIKNGLNTDFAILDAGFPDLIRPALYQSYHKIENISKPEFGGLAESGKRYDVVGPICESTDSFAKGLILPEIKRGDLLAIRTAGAYGEVLASEYNLRDKIKAVYSDEV